MSFEPKIAHFNINAIGEFRISEINAGISKKLLLNNEH